jgi:hypothetical protein
MNDPAQESLHMTTWLRRIALAVVLTAVSVGAIGTAQAQYYNPYYYPYYQPYYYPYYYPYHHSYYGWGGGYRHGGWGGGWHGNNGHWGGRHR